ncbi:MAG: hypothetical protein ABFD96_04550 [Armatimonadia bacterium]
MKVTMALLLLLVVVGMCFVMGCSDDDNDVVIPTDMRGTWLLVAYDDENMPVGGGLVNVAADGKVTAYEADEIDAAQADEAVVSGRVTEAGALTATAEFDEVTYNVVGTLGENDNGSGTWESEGGDPDDPDSGTFVACRANGAEFAGTWNGTVSGDYNGSQSAQVSASGVITGQVDVGGVVAELIGVVNGNHDILGVWGMTEDTPIVVAPGSATSENEASGTWLADSGATGTWDATRSDAD